MTQRIRTWQSALHACVSTRLHKPFAWGSQDCCLFAADCVFAVTGIDPAADLRGTYATEREAARVLQKHGGVAELAFQRIGPVVRTDQAQPGDVGVTQQEGRATLAVCMGAHWLAPGAQGLVHVPPERVARAWRCCKAEEVVHA